MGTLFEDVGRIVRDERAARRLNLAALADAAHVSPKHLECLERGQAGVTMTELDRLAEQLDLEPTALAEGVRREAISPAVFLRHASEFQDFRPEDAEALAYALRQGRALLSLSGDDVRQRVDALDPVEVVAGPRPNAAAKQGYELARRVRERMRLPVEPLTDMRSVLEDSFGIAVLQAALVTPRLPAASVRCPDREGAAVILNARDELRQANPLLDRVHLAHELCHLLFDPKTSGLQIVLDVYGVEDLYEQRARAFAAELLVPMMGLQELLRGEDLRSNAGARVAAIRAREKFGVPWEMTIHHLENCDLIDGALAVNLLEGGAGAYAKPRTKLPEPGEPSIGLCRALEQAVSEANVTEGQARTLLGRAPGQPLPWEGHGRIA